MLHRPNKPALYDAWAGYYDLVEGDRTPMTAFYVSLVTKDTRSILDLGCGTGLIAAAMAQRSAELRAGTAPAMVAGIDESSGLLQIARGRDQRIGWIRGDMRSLPIRAHFDLVVCCYNTLQYLLRDGDLERTIRGIPGVLARQGRFVFDLFQPDLAGLGTPKVDRFQRVITDSSGRRLEFRDDFSYDPETRILTVVWKLLEQRAAGATPFASVRYQMRQYFHDEVQALLADAGLVVLERYGEFDRTPFTNRSMRQIMVCGLRGAAK